MAMILKTAQTITGPTDNVYTSVYAVVDEVRIYKSKRRCEVLIYIYKDSATKDLNDTRKAIDKIYGIFRDKGDDAAFSDFFSTAALDASDLWAQAYLAMMADDNIVDSTVWESDEV